jgi:flavin reductase (DIM6/NTAB) family NADH-FMN oxidoreductase RutF
MIKKEFDSRPPTFNKQYDWYDEIANFSWQDFLTAIPSPLFVATSYKKNGKENACLQSWSTFVGDNGMFICLIGSVSTRGHFYETLIDRKCCVLNFPSRDIYDKCTDTIKNNDYENNEITDSGLTSEKAISVDAPRIKECFLNIECEYLWEHEHYKGSKDVMVALQATHICMDIKRCDKNNLGRYGKTGYMYNIHSPRNPETGEVLPDCFGALEKYN